MVVWNRHKTSWCTHKQMKLVVGQAYMSDYNMTREHVYSAGEAACVCRSPTEPYRLSKQARSPIKQHITLWW